MKTTTHASALAAKVAAFNRAHTEVNRLAPLYRAAVAPFFGKKVTTAQGDYTAAIRKVFPVVGEGVQVHSPHKGCFVVKTCEHYGDHACVYAEPYFYAFTLDREGNAQPLAHEWEPLRTDYTEEKVIELRKVAETAREAARAAESALAPFGEYDR